MGHYDEQREREHDRDGFASQQVGGNHYHSKIDPDKFIEANNLNFREGNIVKYVTRHRRKNGLEDLLKARHYLDMLIKQES